jgi:hypothetical protein
VRRFATPAEHGGERGQSVVEFTLGLTLFMLLLTGMLDFGQLFNNYLTVEYATREGARAGGALVTGVRPGGTATDCGQVASGRWVDPDLYIVAAVQRVLESRGSPIAFADVGPLRISRADSSGREVGSVNVWTPAPGAGPLFDVDGNGVVDTPLDFTGPLYPSAPWSACTRSNAEPPQSIRVSLSYTYRFQFGLAGILRAVVPGSTMVSIPVSDKTVMSFNPTQ